MTSSMISSEDAGNTAPGRESRRPIGAGFLDRFVRLFENSHAMNPASEPWAVPRGGRRALCTEATWRWTMARGRWMAPAPDCASPWSCLEGRVNRRWPLPLWQTMTPVRADAR